MLARYIDFTVIYALLWILGGHVDGYFLPEPKFEALRPRGLRVSIPDESGLQFFAFHANVNKRIGASEPGEISGEVYRAKNGRWTYQNDRVTLRNGDLLRYWIYVQADGSTYKKEDQTWTVVLNEQNPTTERTEISSTTESSKPRLILDENFDRLNKSIWTRDIKMPLAPDYEFCVYHNENHDFLAVVENGMLRFKPMILEELYGENSTAYGRIQLSGCTSTVAIECSKQAVSYNILPPVLSARLTTKQSFYFRYGKVEIRAKFPEGDWLYPEMWLEPKYQSYGPGYASGRVLLGLARGNENLINAHNRSIYDSRRLDFGLRVGPPTDIKEHIVTKLRETGPRWTQDFHVFTTIWTPEEFKFLVDGDEVGSLSPGSEGWLRDTVASMGKKSAPFDQEFYLTLGVGVGGVRVFPDETMSSGNSKPWRNVGAKAMLKFWHAKNEWLPSWKRESGKKTVFKIDYVRVWSS